MYQIEIFFIKWIDDSLVTTPFIKIKNKIKNKINSWKKKSFFSKEVWVNSSQKNGEKKGKRKK